MSVFCRLIDQEILSGVRCPIFGSAVLRKMLRTKMVKWEATEMLCGWMPMSCQERLCGVLGFFPVLKQRATIGFTTVFNYFLHSYRENEVKH